MNIKKIIDRLENSASKHRLRKAVLVAFSLLCLGASAAVPDANMLMTRSITMNMGLPSNSVRCIVQDKNGYMWFGTDYGLCRYDGYTVQTIYNTKLIDQYVGALLPTDDGLLVGTSQGAYFLSFKTEQFELLDKEISAHVAHFSLDGNRNVWISTYGQGVFRYNLASHECRNYPMKGNQGGVNCTLVDVNNQVWALCKKPNRNQQFLLRLNKSTNQFDPFRLKNADVQLSGLAMLANPDGSILVGTWQDGLYQVNADGTTEQIISPLSNAMHHIHQLYNDPNQKVLVGSDDGLVEYDFQKRNWRMMSELKGNSRSTNDRFVYSISSDREGGLWVGTYYGGVNYIPSSAFVSRFQTYYASQESGVRGNVVGRFVEDASRRIWIATDDAGLDCFDPATNRFVDYPGKAQMGKYNVHALLAEGTTLWVGTYGAGLLRMDIGSGSVQTYQLDNVASGSSCYCIYRDSQNRLWATSMEGVNLFNEKKNCFEKVRSFKGLTIDINEDSRGDVWFATQGAGLWCFNRSKAWRQYLHKENDASSLLSNQVNSLCRSDKGRFYVATDKGICEFLMDTGKFALVDVDAPSHDFASIVESQGEMWFSSAKGIVRYVPGEPTLVFNSYDGLTCDQFLPNSGLLASDGRVYFGTTQGFNTFFPYQVKINHVAPPVSITSLELFNKHVEVGSDKLPESLGHIEQLDLSYDDNIINISFAALSYVSPEKNQYAYMLEGFDKEWTTTHEHRATYTNLPYGSYTFRVKAANNDGVWSKEEAQLKIEVHPPFWWTLPAKLLYLLLLGYAIYLYTQGRLKREKRRHQHELDALEEKQQQEVRDARLQFFTMIAHEIRTPVSLIIGPLENLKGEWAKLSVSAREGKVMNDTIDVIDRNAQRLLNLVNQLLDFNKVQQSGMQVHFKLQNISKLIAAVVERFEPTLRKNGTKLEVNYPKNDFAAVIDKEAITKVISNLMTNANKYTKNYVCLSCDMADSEHFRIVVTDNGDGIGADEQEKIFSAFYQAKDNKPGTVEVESEVGRGASFVVTLPIRQQDAVVGEDEKNDLASQVVDADSYEAEKAEGDEAASGDGMVPDASGTLDGSGTPGGKKTKTAMLVVEDDADMRQFIASNFAGDYLVFTAENGVEGLRQLKLHPTITLIVSDWMMPEMDGAEFCRRVRQDAAFSHIPFVMLTAKTDDSSKTEGMNCGADAYIEKPFSMKYLEACIRNLLEMRRLLQTKYSHMPMEPITEVASNDTDNEFLVRMNELIEENITNPCLSVVFLAEQMSISRSTLFAKIKALVDVTPNEMIQLVKLKKAAALLKSGKYRISEVCYMTGFSSPSYFSKCFQKQFGMKPGEFMEQG